MQRLFLSMTILLTLVTANCSSAPQRRAHEDIEQSASTAPGAAYTGYGMYPRKETPERTAPNPWEFYYKHCALSGRDDVFSKNAYECSSPAY